MSSKLNYAVNVKYPKQVIRKNLNNPLDPVNYYNSLYNQTTMDSIRPQKTWKDYVKCCVAYSVIFLGICSVIFLLVFGINNLALYHMHNNTSNRSELNETIDSLLEFNKTIDDPIIQLFFNDTDEIKNTSIIDEEWKDIDLRNKTIILNKPNNTIIITF
jgi:hypothetical protein